MNPLQLAAITGLISALKTVRNLDAGYVIVPTASVPTVSNYVINPLSVCVQVQDAAGVNLLDFPVIEIRKTGKFALPSIRSYRESAGQNALQPYPQGATAFDAALYADSHVRKQNGVRLRRCATAAITSAVSEGMTAMRQAGALALPVPANISAETGQDTVKLTAEIQGKGKAGK